MRSRGMCKDPHDAPPAVVLVGAACGGVRGGNGGTRGGAGGGGGGGDNLAGGGGGGGCASARGCGGAHCDGHEGQEGGEGQGGLHPCAGRMGWSALVVSPRHCADSRLGEMGSESRSLVCASVSRTTSTVVQWRHGLQNRCMHARRKSIAPTLRGERSSTTRCSRLSTGATTIFSSVGPRQALPEAQDAQVRRRPRGPIRPRVRGGS